MLKTAWLFYEVDYIIALIVSIFNIAHDDLDHLRFIFKAFQNLTFIFKIYKKQFETPNITFI